MSSIHFFSRGKALRYVLYSLALCTLVSCEIINPPEDIPSYVYVRPFSLTTASNQGSNKHKITDAWVSIEDIQSVGAYSIPNAIPVLTEGTKTITIRPGVIENGIVTERIIYPFYTAFTTTVDLEPITIDTITPNTTYVEGLTFAVNERFEGSPVLSVLTGGINTTYSHVNGNFEGKAARITVSDTTVAILTTIAAPSLDRPSTADPSLFVEMHYRTNNSFEVGLRALYVGGDQFDHYKIDLKPREDWNKLYLRFNTEVDELNADSYQVIFRIIPDAEVDVAEIFIDNLKIIHF